MTDRGRFTRRAVSAPHREVMVGRAVAMADCQAVADRFRGIDFRRPDRIDQSFPSASFAAIADSIRAACPVGVGGLDGLARKNRELASVEEDVGRRLVQPMSSLDQDRPGTQPVDGAGRGLGVIGRPDRAAGQPFGLDRFGVTSRASGIRSRFTDSIASACRRS